RLNAPALRHAVATRRQAKESRQFDDLGIAVVFFQLFVDLLVTTVVECESPGVVESSASLRVRVLPVRKRAARFILLCDGCSKRRGLPRAEFAANHLGDLDARQLLDLMRDRAASVEVVPIAREGFRYFGIVTHSPVPGLRRTLRYRSFTNDLVQLRVMDVLVVNLWNARRIRQERHLGPLPNSLEAKMFQPREVLWHEAGQSGNGSGN